MLSIAALHPKIEFPILYPLCVFVHQSSLTFFNDKEILTANIATAVEIGVLWLSNSNISYLPSFCISQLAGKKTAQANFSKFPPTFKIHHQKGGFPVLRPENLTLQLWKHYRRQVSMLTTDIAMVKFFILFGVSL